MPKANARLFDEFEQFLKWLPEAEIEQMKLDGKVEPCFEMRGDLARMIGWKLKPEHETRGGCDTNWETVGTSYVPVVRGGRIVGQKPLFVTTKQYVTAKEPRENA